MSTVRTLSFAVAVACSFIGCIGSRSGLFRGQTPAEIQQTAGATGKTIYVVGHGWHTGLVIQADDLSQPLRPGATAPPDSGYVEIGWGDEGFYRAKSITPGLVFRAIFTPTPSVLHLVRFQQLPEEVFAGSDVVALQVSDAEFETICRHVRDSFATGDDGKAVYLSRGIYGDSAFYRGHESYFYPKTCNVWTARALQAGGLPILSPFSTTAGGVIAQASFHGRVLSKSSPMAMIHALGMSDPTGKPDGR